MNYTLSRGEESELSKTSVWGVLKKLLPLLLQEKQVLAISFIAILISSGMTILAPVIIGHTVDTYIIKHDFHGVLVYAGLLLGVFAIGLIAMFFQTRLMGEVGQRILFRLRNAVFKKLEELPVAFFNQNKAGDLISRINNDTDKLNQFFSRSLMQFVGNIFVIIGAGIAMLVVQPRLGLASLVPAVLLMIVVMATSAWVKKRNFESLQKLGGMSAEIQESLDNFKVIIAFNRRDYFRSRFIEANESNYRSAIKAGVANNTYVPIFSFASSLGQMIVIVYGLSLITSGFLTFGLLISYLAYVTRFYDPLRQMAQLWSDLQTALAGWDRIVEITNMQSDLEVLPAETEATTTSVLEFRGVGFHYPNGKEILTDVNFNLERGKIYALVGPTGGGKTTTASLMARLYDPTTGTVLLDGRDIRTFDPAERTKRIGFILQEPFLFSGTVGENILYGNDQLGNLSNKELSQVLKKEKLDDLIARFDQGLDTPVSSLGETISLGQRQLIAFMRAMLRHPELLVLDEATANIDTVTEKLLEEVLQRLPKETTRVVIAHRLNTIANADQIFFVNGGAVTLAGSLDDAVNMLTKGKRTS